MAPTFKIQVSEPHPSVSVKPKTQYISAGRGGAGNVKSYDASRLTAGQTATGPASRLSVSGTTTTPSSSTPRQHVFSGIGGAGNARPASERRMFSFDEELERQQRLAEAASATPIYHIGRGGAGNAVASSSKTEPSAVKTRQMSSAESVSSAGSAVSGVERAKRSLEGVRGKLARALSRE